jgi:hypothetical protein
MTRCQQVHSPLKGSCTGRARQPSCTPCCARVLDSLQDSSVSEEVCSALVCCTTASTKITVEPQLGFRAHAHHLHAVPMHVSGLHLFSSLPLLFGQRMNIVAGCMACTYSFGHRREGWLVDC